MSRCVVDVHRKGEQLPPVSLTTLSLIEAT
jgi:hypothetical protein